MAFDPPDLLAHRSPYRQIAGMQSRHVERGVMGRDEFSGDGVEVERRGIDHPRAGRTKGDDLARHQRTRKQTHRTACHQILAAHRDQIGRAGTGADEEDGHGAKSLMKAAAAAAVAWRSAETMRVTTSRAPAPAAASAAASQTQPTPRWFSTCSQRLATCASTCLIASAATVST